METINHFSLEQDGTATPKITSPRQYRALRHLSQQPATCFELQTAAGARNVPQLVSDLSDKGWVIPYELLDIKDRDGKLTKPGRYHLKPEQIPIARQVLEKWEESHNSSRGA